MGGAGLTVDEAGAVTALSGLSPEAGVRLGWRVAAVAGAPTANRAEVLAAIGGDRYGVGDAVQLTLLPPAAPAATAPAPGSMLGRVVQVCRARPSRFRPPGTVLGAQEMHGTQ